MSTLLVISIIAFLSLILEIVGLRKLSIPITLLGLIFAILMNVLEVSGIPFFVINGEGMMVTFKQQNYFNILFIILTSLILILTPKYYNDRPEKISDYISLKVFMLAGAIAMIGFANLIMFFLGLEVLSMAAYILSTGKPEDLKSNEAGMKYIIMGAVASSFVLLGIAFVYGSLATMDIFLIKEGILNELVYNYNWLYFGVLLICIGMFFKSAIFPFQFWAPDVYQGAPIVTTTIMSTLVKVAALCSFFYLADIFFLASSNFTILFMALAIASMTIANIIALRQKNLKRLMAFSGISHAGFILLTFVGIDGILEWNDIIYYTYAYSLASLVVFAIIMIVCNDNINGEEDISKLRGLFFRSPWLSSLLLIALMSLGGIPFLAGFFAKYALFMSLVYDKQFVVVSLAVLNSVLAIYYYFSVINTMFQTDFSSFLEAKNAGKTNILKIDKSYAFVAIFASILLIVLSLFMLWWVLF